MKKGLLLAIIITLVVVITAGAGCLAYFKLNSTPKKIFAYAIEKSFDKIKEKQINYNTIKGKVELSANIESNNQQVAELNKQLESSKIVAELEADIKNLFVNENLLIKYDNEDLLNGRVLIQDQKVYLEFKNWFNKYIEMPEDYFDLSEMTKASTIDNSLLLEAVKQELSHVISEQSFTKETVVLNLNGKNVKTTKSSIKLNDLQRLYITKDLLTGLKNNINFQNGLGEYKEELIQDLDKSIDVLNKNINNYITNVSNQDVNNNNSSSTTATYETPIVISIYTTGLLNKVVACDCTFYNEEKESGGIAFIKTSDEKYELHVYDNENDEKKNLLDLYGEEKNGQGLIKATIQPYNNNNNEKIEFICNYKKKQNQTIYTASTKIKNYEINIEGSNIKENSGYNGRIVFGIKIDENQRINLNCVYNVLYNTEIQKLDVSNSTKLNEMTKEEQQELSTNFQNSKLYNLLNIATLDGLELFSKAKGAIEESEKEIEGKGMITGTKHIIIYDVPAGFTYDKENSIGWQKKYVDSKNNKIDVGFAGNIDEYLETREVLGGGIGVETEYSDTRDYSFNGNDFKFKGAKVTHASGITEYLFFAYRLDDETSYVVEVTAINGDVSLEDVNSFLTFLVTYTVTYYSNDSTEDETYDELDQSVYDSILNGIENGGTNNNSDSDIDYY